MITASRLIPLWLKIAYTAFMAVLIPVYLKNYGPTNFLYFCDVVAILTIYAIWVESPLLLSAALVGSFLPQMLWVVDFVCQAAGYTLTGMTSYMFQPPFFLRFLSFFHFWLVFLLIYLVWRVGYDKRGLPLWVAIMWVLLTVCYAWMPPPSPSVDPVTKQVLRDPNMPVNINYVWGPSDNAAQTWVSPHVWLAGMMIGMPLLLFWPVHILLSRYAPRPA